MRINLLDSHADNHPKPVDLSWDELIEFLTAPPPVKSHDPKGFNLPAWIPASLPSGARASDNVEAVSCLVLDYDEQKVEQWAGVLESVQAMGLQYIYHSTRSHAPVDGQLSYRLVLRLTRNVLGREWPGFWSTMARELGASNDRKTKDLVRLYYRPVQIESAPQFECGHGGAEALDVDTVLSMAAEAATEKQPAPDEGNTRERLERMLAKEPKGDWGMKGYTTLKALLGKTHGDYAEQGDRDEALYACAGFILRRAQNLDPQTIVNICMPRLAVPGCRHADGATFLDKLQRAAQEVQDELQNADPIRMFQLNREGPYRESDISTFLAEQGLATPEHLKAQLLVRHQQSLYAFFEGSYRYVGTTDSGDDSARQKLLPAEVPLQLRLNKFNAEGVLTPCTFKQLFQNYGRAVDYVVPSLSARISTVHSATLTLAVCPRRIDLVPAHDPAIDAWLRSWGDDTLLDWLATAPKLERATAALYLCGVKRAGKTMLAEGLGAIWGSAPTDMDSLGENFNDAVTDCPVVLADDTVPDRFRRDSGLLRRLITARTVTLNRKYMPTAKMTGSLRFVFAMNNLHLFNSEESVGRDDVDAICERLLFYRLTEPSDYFPPVRLAQHILWLEDTREVPATSSDRLWVSGRDSELHRHMRISSRERALVCHWIMQFLNAPHRLAESAGSMFKLGDGALLLNPRLIYDKFEVLLPKERQLSLHQVAKVIGELGHRRQRGLFAINLADLVQWSQENAWSVTEAELEAIINQGAAMLEKRTN